MATPIIAALRQRHLKESLLHTAQELAHLASIYGVVKVSYAYLALTCRCSGARSCAISSAWWMPRSSAKRSYGLGNFCEINTYTFRIAWDRSRPRGVVTKRHGLFHPKRGRRTFR